MADSGNKGKAAAGLGGVVHALVHTWRNAGLTRGVQALHGLNQEEGFDCPGCAWPEPEQRSATEFCENGAKAVAHEATTKKADAAFFADWAVSELHEKSDRWLEAQGRLVQPMIRRTGEDFYDPISWEDALAHVGTALRSVSAADRAVFYTSGRTSNEAAFLYQLFARQFGTNNLPDCSNMCHESSGTGLGETIGVGKGTVGLDDFDLADAIFVVGQNPGTNHPRMLTALQNAKKRGCRIVSINPLRERALLRFSNPQHPLELLGASTEISDLYLQVRVGGDVAAFKGIMKHLFEAEQQVPGSAVDQDFVDKFTDGFTDLRTDVLAACWEDLEEKSGLDREQLGEAARIYRQADKVIACWAMGLTQHRNGVDNVREITNLLLLGGNIGRPGAGPCPVRGHSNVQGDRTMGIHEKPAPEFLDSLEAEFGIRVPREHGFDTVATLEAMLEDRVDVFFAMGGNFAAASPDSVVAHRALSRCSTAVHVATKLNRTHLVAGQESLLLPCLGRSEIDAGPNGPRFVTVEDSMSVVHRSTGRLAPASYQLRSEPSIVAGVAHATLGHDSPLDWNTVADDYDGIRDRIARVVPGFDDFNRRVRKPGGFVLPNGARERHFNTASGKARFTVNPLPDYTLASGRFLMMTMRSHDQFNTTVYGLDDRYRGVHGQRRVVFLNADDIAQAGLHAGQWVDLTSHFRGQERSVTGFRIVAYDIPPRCAATYFPEANPLVPLESFAEGSRTPAYKSVEISLAPGQAPTEDS